MPSRLLPCNCHHSSNPSTQKSLVFFVPKSNVNAPVANAKIPNGVHFRLAGGSRSQRRAVELLDQGETPAVVGRILGVRPTSLHRWRMLARRTDGLAAKPPSGAKRRLCDAQLAELEQLLLQGAPAHGFPNELWTAARVAQIIKQHFGVKYHPEHVRRLLNRRLDWTSHKPQKRARQRNDKECERWKADELPHILREAWCRGAHVAFLGDIPHQVCEFHILKELTLAVLRVLAQIRKRLRAQKPKLLRGRPTKTAEGQRQHRQAQTIQQRVSALFEHRHLFVRHYLSAAERGLLLRLARPDRRLRALREIMDEVYRLFDRRCRTDSALSKLSKLRQRVRRFRSLGKSLAKLDSPNLEKALTFLDDTLLPATSNAVERDNRRHRKMQKTIDRVRTHAALVGRMAMDLQRDQQAEGRDSTIKCLHQDREETL